jgi:hypothetical protein
LRRWQHSCGDDGGPQSDPLGAAAAARHEDVVGNKADYSHDHYDKDRDAGKEVQNSAHGSYSIQAGKLS